jgi:hypothetical protein
MIARERHYESPVVGDKLQDNVEKYERYKVDAIQKIQFIPGPDPAVVASMTALHYLTGNARKAVLKLCTRHPLDKLMSLDEVFDEVCDNIHIIVPEEYYLMLELLVHEMVARKMLRCKDIFKLLCVNPHEALLRRDRLTGAALCKELQDLRVKLDTAWALL